MTNRKNDEIESEVLRFTPKWDEKLPLPRTRFTRHVVGLVNSFDFGAREKDWSIFLTGNRPNSRPTVTHNHNGGGNVILERYQYVLENHVFPRDESRRILPGNVSFCVHGGDYSTVKPGERSACFASSSLRGYFSVHNFQTVKQWRENVSWPTPLPWNDRIAKPVWRGIAWYPGNLGNEATLRIANGTSTFLDAYARHPSHQKRCALDLYSADHPELVDAKVTDHIGFPENLRYLWQENVTGGMPKILPFHRLPSEKYYTEYQVHVVMGGFGAAFRTPIIFRQGIAVKARASQ